MEGNIVDYEEAKLFLQKRKINTLLAWLKFTHSEDFPSFLPKEPLAYYRGKGWVSYDDFLNINTIYPSKFIEKLVSG